MQTPRELDSNFRFRARFGSVFVVSLLGLRFVAEARRRAAACIEVSFCIRVSNTLLITGATDQVQERTCANSVGTPLMRFRIGGEKQPLAQGVAVGKVEMSGVRPIRAATWRCVPPNRVTIASRSGTAAELL